MPGGAGAQLADLAHGFRGAEAKGSRAHRKGLARRGEANTASHALEERRSQRSFQPANAPGECGLGTKELRRRAAEVSGLGNGLEIAQVAQVQFISHAYRK